MGNLKRRVSIFAMIVCQILLAGALFAGQACSHNVFTVPDAVSKNLSGSSSEDSSQLPGAVSDNDNEPAAVFKPKGTYSAMAVDSALSNPTARGTLIRVFWEDIEPDPNGDVVLNDVAGALVGLEKSFEIMNKTGRDLGYSLGIIAGPHSPAWLKDLGAAYMDVPLQTSVNSIPKYWDPIVQERLKILAQKVAAQLKSDSRLKLVYVPQMTANGIEGHFNGISNIARGATPANGHVLTDAGYTEDVWVRAGVQAAKSFAQAFDNKAIAFEVHEILENANVAKRIMYDLWTDPDLDHRVGIGMWWISGTVDYQPELIQIIKDFPGDKYGQIIGNSTQDCNPNPTCTDGTGKSWSNYGRYGEASQGGGFASVFKQAKELKMRYIEPWNYEFSNNTHNEVFSEYNKYVDENFK